MFRVSSELYDQIACRLREAFGDAGYFSGSVDCAAGETECRLTASLVLYRCRDEWPEGPQLRLTDAVPVWWEFHTVTAGVEEPNDFSFAELRPVLLA